MLSWKLALTRFCAQLERCCARMNNGLFAVAVMLATAVVVLTVMRIPDEIVRAEQLGKLPYIEMSTDGPDVPAFSD